MRNRQALTLFACLLFACTPPRAWASGQDKDISKPAASTKTPAQKQSLLYKTFRDPKEGAFTIQVPQQWKVRGGTLRPDLLVITFEVTAMSPDGTLSVSLRQNESGRIVPTPGVQMMGGKEGGVYHDPVTGTRFPIQRYRPGALFLTELVFPEYRNDSQGRWHKLEVLAEKDRSDLAQALTIGAPIERIDASEVHYSFQRGRQQYRGGALVVTRFLSGLGGLDFWHLATLALYEAPEDQERETKAALVRILSTFRVTEQWAAGIDQKLKNQVKSITSSGNATAQIINSAYWRQQKVKDSIFWKGSSIRLDRYQVQDPLTGQEYTVRNTSNYYWVDPRGTVTGTDDPQPPGILFRPLMIVDEK